MPGAFKSWNRKCVHTLNILASTTLQECLTKTFHFPLIKFPLGLMSEYVQSALTHNPFYLVFVSCSQRDAHTHVEWCQRCCSDLSLTPTVPHQWYHTPILKGINLKRTNPRSLPMPDTVFTHYLHFYWMDLCVGGYQPVWLTPCPSDHPLLQICQHSLFLLSSLSPPLLACVCLNHCRSDVGMVKLRWYEETPVIPVSGDFTNICQGFPAWEHK